MNLIVCLDNHGGMLFNHRRQSRDRTVLEDIFSMLAGRRLWVNDFSAPLFAGRAVTVDNEFLTAAGQDDFCFVENVSVGAAADRIDSITVYRWNRDYPADFFFDLFPIPDTWQLCRTEEFSGYSHEKITKEVYCR